VSTPISIGVPPRKANANGSKVKPAKGSGRPLARVQGLDAAVRGVDEPSDAEFSAAVTAATTMFGDPTRRRIYLFARESPVGVTASEAAQYCELHPNVARHHLDKLAGGGYLDVVSESAVGRSGRPAKRFRSTGKPIDLAFPARRHDLIVSLLSKALELLPNDVASKMAEEVGEHYGRELAAQINPGDRHRTMQSALHAVAEALTAHGFAAHTEAREGAMAIVRDHCPFGDLSDSHPVICAVDRGLVKGMLFELYGTASGAFTESRPLGDDVCVELVK
jgi:predicted ArsR family transcriptional regulator